MGSMAVPPPQRMRGDLGLNSKVEGRRKPEGRKPETRRPKVEGRNKSEPPSASGFFGFRPSAFFRPSGFGLRPSKPAPSPAVFVLQSYPLGKPRKLSRQSPGVSRLFRCGSDLRSDGSRSLWLRSLGAGETPRQRPGQPSDWRSAPRLDLSRYRGWAESHLATRRRNDARKQAIVVRLRNETTMPVKWTAAWVHIGTRPMAATKLNPRGPTNPAHNSNSNLGLTPARKKTETRRSKPESALGLRFRTSDFGIRPSFGLRPSGFGFQLSSARIWRAPWRTTS